MDWLDGNGNAAPVVTSTQQEQSGITLDQLLEQFDAETIMAANGGKIPATQEEVEQANKILAGGVKL